MSTANEPKSDQLSPTPALLAPLLHLSKLWAPIALPKEDGEKAGAVLSTPPSCLAQPGWQLRLIASPHLSSHIR